MSWQRGALNGWLRRIERPKMARGTLQQLRRNLETSARLLFHPPRGSRIAPVDLGGVPGLSVTGPGAGGPVRILYLHGGGYVFGSARTHSAMLAQLSKRSRMPAVLPDYRRAPEHPFPAAFEDALAAYLGLAEQPGDLLIGGDSAGGGLALALLAEILRRDLPRPLGVFAFSPLTDLTFSGRSFRENAARDAVLPAERASELAGMYLAGADPKDLRASPLWADFTGAPPVWICAGDTEILLDDTRRMVERLRAQGVDVTARIERDLPHVWPFFHHVLPEARATLADLATWAQGVAQGVFEER